MTAPRCVWALVPVRSFRTGKSRLYHLGDGRDAIARALFARACDVLRAAPGIAGVLIATDGADVAAAAATHDIDVIFDLANGTLASIADRGLDQLARRGADAAIVLMGDLPLIGAADIAALVASLAGADVVVAPDRDQLGTNALAVRLPAPIRACFGHGDSYRLHLAAATGRDLSVTTCPRAGLAFDLDGPDDLDDLLAIAALPAEAKLRIASERVVRTEAAHRTVEAVERIAAIVVAVGAVDEGVHHPVERGPLGGDPPGPACGPS